MPGERSRTMGAWIKGERAPAGTQRAASLQGLGKKENAFNILDNMHIVEILWMNVY